MMNTLGTQTLDSIMVMTVPQALQLVGLVPSLFVMTFLLVLLPHNKQVAVPALYFASLACGFLEPLSDLFPWVHSLWWKGGLLVGRSTLVAFSFLLICQFILGRVPPPAYWLVLAIPLAGGVPLVYASLLQEGDSCMALGTCTDVRPIRALYTIFSSSLVFLLLVYYSSSFSGLGDDAQKKHKYWLIIALILLHVMLLAVGLAWVSGHMTQEQAELASTMFRLVFIYVVLVSLFSVFYPGLAGGKPFEAPVYDPAVDLPHVGKLRVLLEQERVYRQMQLNRARLAKLVGIGEHHLSRVINRHFNRSFRDLINDHRIEEAKYRLRNESAQITTIGLEVGFNSIASFNRVFKTKVGVSPTEYRNNQSPEPPSQRNGTPEPQARAV